MSHCPACAIAAELSAHRDSTAGTWSIRRMMLNFAVIIAQRNCPDYTPNERPQGAQNEETEKV